MNNKISVRGGFSDRNGIKKINTELQYKEFDERTRIKTKNYLFRVYNLVYSIDIGINNYELPRLKREFFEKIYDDIFVETICGQDGLYEERV